MDERRIILLGKTGSGKSSLGNTIFGEEIFRARSSSMSWTDEFRPPKKEINGKSICLIDTPGVFDTDQDNTDVTEMLYNCVQECAPGPHAFLLVLKVERHTQQEQDVVRKILKYFSAEALKYTTVVFTHGDQLEEGQKIEDWYKENATLRSLVRKCGGRCHVFDNKYWNNSQDSYRNNQVQVRELLRTIEETVKNRGRCYNNGFWKHIKHKKIKVPLKYVLPALLGAAAVGGLSAFLVAKFAIGPSLIAGAGTSAAAGAAGAVGAAGAAGAVGAVGAGALASSAQRGVKRKISKLSTFKKRKK